ncbi:MAG TPA: M36 family metallopeptidase [Kofleriaceae bacterium]
MSILSSDASGTPRLIRAIVPRPAAGMAPVAAALDHVAALSPLWVQKAQPMSLADNGTAVLRNGASVVKLTQHVGGVPVDQGELRVLLHADGSLAAVSGTLLPSVSQPTFVSSPVEALGHALDQQYGASRPQLAITDTGETGGWHALAVASTPQLQVTEARARRVLAQVDTGMIEAWEVEVQGDAAPDPSADPSFPTFSAHSYLVADAGGKVLRDDDLAQRDAFVYRAYMEATGNRRPLDGPLQSFAPHPTGVPDGSAPGLLPAPNLVVMEAFNGPVDKWLPDNATTTSGNNAEAFADLDATRTFTPGDVRPAVKSGRVLNYNYDHTLGPLATTDQSSAGAVNAFFMVNWMHDWWYDSGFTEAAGNAQLDNLGRGGVAGDPLLVTSQAGANTGLRNNADMSTPADGARPRMRMFLWTAGTNTAITAPTGTPRSEAFSAGPRNFDLVGNLVLATDGTAPTDDACQPITNNVAGKIVLANFSGVCGSAATVNDAKAAGAIGIILADPASDDPRAFAGSAAANIPGLAIGKTDGAALQAALAAGPVTVELQSAVAGVERDGDLDNTVVGHEWGHYLHHRLAICGTQQCGGMSEGWGDFNALMMMVRDGDNRDGVYAMAPYAINDGVTPDFAYFGIRRFPYSRDRTKNNLSFRHIGDENPLPTDTAGHPGGANSEVHNTGEVWATMMWEALNVLADQHGATVARRRMSDYVVAGLLLTPPNATFTEGRDGILAAASALDTDDMILMAAAFAGRGAGSCAVSPSNSSATNAGVVESGTLAGKLVVGGISLTDDGISCDHDGYLDPGESGQLHVTVANNGILAAENVAITATTANTGVRLGPPIKMAALQPFASSSLTIPVTLLPTAPRNTTITINLHVSGDDTCDKKGVDASVTVRTGVDELPSASNVDHADTKISPWTPTGTSAAAIWGRTADATGNLAFFGADAGSATDTQFTSPPLPVSTTQPFVLKFSHAYNLEGSGTQLFDGGVVEISLNGGTTWSDVTAFGVKPGYTGALVTNTGNPIGGRQAYSGASPGFPALSPVTLNFGTVFAGLSVMVRFRIGTDAAVSVNGWIIDDVEVDGITSTPFPMLVNEPSTCTARERSLEDSSVIATRVAPAESLRAFDAGVCILQDTP